MREWSITLLLFIFHESFFFFFVLLCVTGVSVVSAESNNFAEMVRRRLAAKVLNDEIMNIKEIEQISPSCYIKHKRLFMKGAP